MAPDPIVFAMSNPTPEVMPEEAERTCASWPRGLRLPKQDQQRALLTGVFRSALDAAPPRITEPMELAAAKEIAEVVEDDDLSEDYIIP